MIGRLRVVPEQRPVVGYEVDQRIDRAIATGASTLDLRGLGLTSLPDSLGGLTQLQSLAVSHNRLTSLPDWLGNLTQLQSLDASHNRLASLPDALGGLGQLHSLFVSHNRLASLPDALGRLARLHSLFVPDNRLTSLPDALGRLPRLEGLFLSDNRLTSLPDALGGLARLESLAVSRNRLTSLPDTLGGLAQLQRLDASHNLLTSLPDSLRGLTALSQLYLHDNPGLGIPPEILGHTWIDRLEHDKKASNPAGILEYYFRARFSQRPINEAKLILVGFGGVGKTSIVNRLVRDDFDDLEARTDGIAITDWPISAGKDEVRLHLWDFGGQEIMHATHQFFLTQRSLYLLVLSGREGREDADADYWLSLIASFAPDSPVIVVLNKITQHAFALNRGLLQQKFRNVREIVATDCKDRVGIDAVAAAIRRETDLLPHLRDPFPRAWFEIKDRLSGMTDNFLTFDRYQALCREHGETEPAAQELLATFLHHLGVALSYRDDPRLNDTHVLNPRWVTEGVYALLTHPTLVERTGVLHLADLRTLLDPSTYPPECHVFLVELMRKFDLCLPFPDGPDRFLVPELLPKEQPEEADAFPPEGCLNFEYHYPRLLPEGLLPRFIVRTYTLSEEGPRWRTGAILALGRNEALVVGDPVARRIRVAIKGPLDGRRRLLAVIRADFDRIHANYKFRPKEMVPVPGRPEIVLPYRKLETFERNDRRTIEEDVGDEIVTLDVRELLDGVDLKGTRVAGARRDRRKVRAFVSYSHKDERYRAELDTHLKLLQRQGLLDLWTDRRIAAGTEWRGQIDENLERADLVLLLVTADFVASDYCYDVELRRALERHEEGSARVIPIIVRTVDWHGAPFGELQSLPRDGRAVATPSGGKLSRDEAWTYVAGQIAAFLQEPAAVRH